jgi:hypothetical protein
MNGLEIFLNCMIFDGLSSEVEKNPWRLFPWATKFVCSGA